MNCNTGSGNRYNATYSTYVFTAMFKEKSSKAFTLLTDHIFSDIRAVAPDHFLLVPGVGAQGGSLKEVAEYGMTRDCGLIVNASRQILYASDGEDFAQAARNEALKLQHDMSEQLKMIF